MAPSPSNKKKARARQLPLLPDDVIEDILARLPAKLVLRCRCLSRGWAAVLSSRGFINRHLDLANRGSRRVLCPVSQLPAWSRDVVPLTRSCRGLVLLSNISRDVYYVCNPSTGQVASLPDGTAIKGTDAAACLGLGYDARAERHKVVRLYHHAGCEVYDVGGPSSTATGYWRRAAARPPCSADGSAGVFVQGQVHWLATTKPWRLTRPPDSLMSFSVQDETFTSVPLPRRARARSCRSGGDPPLLDLTVTVPLGGRGRRLVLVSYRASGLRDMWALQDAGAGAWDMLCRNNVPVDGGALFSAVVDDHHYVLEESLESAGRPHEDIIFASPSAQALSLALRRLPARALGRTVKRVGRSWRAIVESDRFVASHNEHHRRSTTPSIHFARCFPLPPTEQFSCLSWSDLLTSTTATLPPLTNRRVFVSKPCHGLALVSCGGGRFAVFNPVMRFHRYFALGYIFFGRTTLAPLHLLHDGCVGLGYDRSTEQHVLVAIIASSSCTAGDPTMECRVWRLRDDLEPRPAPAPPIPVSLDAPPAYLDGKLFWLGRRSSSVPAAILAFDIAAEAFATAPAPPSFMDDIAVVHGLDSQRDHLRLVELRGLLCAVHTCPATETMTVWSSSAASFAGSKDWGQQRWTREYVIRLEPWPEFSPRTAAAVPLAVEPRQDGRVLLDTGRALGLYDPVSRTLQTVYSLRSKLQSHDDDDHKQEKLFFAAMLWDESLVRPYDRCDRYWW